MGALSDLLASPKVQGVLAPVVNRVLGRQPQAPPQAPQPQQQAAPQGPDPMDLLSDPKAYAQALSQAGAPAPYVLSRVSELVKQQKELADLGSVKLGNKQKSYEQAGNLLEGYMQAPTPENWKRTHDALKDAEPEIHSMVQEFDPATGAAPTEQQLAPLLGMTLAHAKMVANAKTVADTKEAIANTAKTEAQTPGEKAASEEKQFKLDLLKKAASGQAADLASSVRGMSIFADHPQEAQDAIDAGNSAYKAAMASGDPLKAATEAHSAISAIADRLRANSPGVVAGEVRKQTALEPGNVKQAKDVAAATAATQEAISAAESNHRNALEQGDTATAKYYESLTGAEKAKATAQTIQHVVQLARSGSPLASQQLKAMVPEFTNAAQDIKRMGGTQAASMSSELDKAIGEIKSLGGGSTLSEDTVNAIAPFVETIANGAVSQHNANVQALKKAYPQKQFSTESLPHQSATGKDGHKIVSHDGGDTWFDAVTGKAVK